MAGMRLADALALLTYLLTYSLCAGCIAVVKSFNDDDSSSDYEDVDDDVTSAVTSLAGGSAAADGGDDGEYEVYDDVIGEAATVIQHPHITITTSAPVQSDDDDGDDLIYECCDDVVTPSRDPLTSQPNMAAGQDYANMYYGRWDCAAGDGNELAFRHGDVLVIVSREFDTFGWWIGALNGSVGLVPKDYLSPAYELVSA